MGLTYTYIILPEDIWSVYLSALILTPELSSREVAYACQCGYFMGVDGGCRRAWGDDFTCPPGWEVADSYDRTCRRCSDMTYKSTTAGTCKNCACFRNLYFDSCGPVEPPNCKSCTWTCGENTVWFDWPHEWEDCKNDPKYYDYDKCRAYNLMRRTCGIPRYDGVVGSYNNQCETAAEYFDRQFRNNPCPEGMARTVKRSCPTCHWEVRCIDCLQFALSYTPGTVYLAECGAQPRIRSCDAIDKRDWKPPGYFSDPVECRSNVANGWLGPGRQRGCNEASVERDGFFVSACADPGGVEYTP
eukprot:1557094-Rhodomonas_salina.1